MAFNVLPIELNKEIATYLETDEDICIFRRICRSTRDAIDGDNGSFWRGRFAARFDALGDDTRPSWELKEVYQARSRVIKDTLSMRFNNGLTRTERVALNLMRDLINESFNAKAIMERDEFGRPTCKNLELIRQCALSSNIIEEMFRPNVGDRIHSLMGALQLTLAHLSLDCTVTEHAFTFEESQKQAYASSVSYPIFIGKKKSSVNLTWVRHTLNFFRHHFVVEKDGLLYRHLKDLAADELPSSWTGKLRNGTSELETYWKGTYAYIEHTEISALRSRPAGERFFSDGHLADDGEQKDPIQTLTLNFSKDTGGFWPAAFEKHLPSRQMRTIQAQQAQHRVVVENDRPLYFEGRGTDDEDFLSAGHLNALPSQQGIPGWQRMVMMKYYRLEGTDAVDMDALWAYEGVVLPGGKIILGRWWAPDMVFPNGDTYSGPFILWNVAPPKVERADSVLDE